MKNSKQIEFTINYITKTRVVLADVGISTCVASYGHKALSEL